MTSPLHDNDDDRDEATGAEDTVLDHDGPHASIGRRRRATQVFYPVVLELHHAMLPLFDACQVWQPSAFHLLRHWSFLGDRMSVGDNEDGDGVSVRTGSCGPQRPPFIVREPTKDDSRIAETLAAAHRNSWSTRRRKRWAIYSGRLGGSAIFPAMRL
jgi:hypothetical protein